MNIAIIGGGNIGTAMAAEFSSRGHCVKLQTSKPEKFSDVLSVVLSDNNEVLSGKPTLIADDVPAVVDDAEMVIVTLPAFLMTEFAKKAEGHIKPGAIIVAMPGYGGVEYIFANHIRAGAVLVGFQRVPAVYRLIEYGKASRQSGKRDCLYFASMPGGNQDSLQQTFVSVFGMPCRPLPNFLCVTLTPSNPILHTTRLYSLFGKADFDFAYDSNPMFYGDWSDEASDLLIKCDAELQRLLLEFDELDLSDVRSLTVHYESSTVEAMTAKLSSIKSLGGIGSPMIEKDGKFYVDRNSRYFLADFPYGLAIIKGIAVIAGFDCPNIDLVLRRYAQWSGQEYYCGNEFNGRDLKNTGIPQNYGITTKAQFIEYYLK